MHEFESKPSLTGTQKFAFFSGLILPVISITIESTTHICAETFFDPIPTMWHLLLVIFVPLAQLHVWFVVRRGAIALPALTGLLNAVTIGISVFYTIIYLPLLPLAAMTLLFIIGILPLTPVLSLVASLILRVQLKRIAVTTNENSFALRKAGLFAGLAITALLLGAIELPGTLTRYGLQMASSYNPEKRSQGIQFLRTFGSREHLLRACYGRSGWASELFGFFFIVQDPVSTFDAQNIYYRVTGENFETSAPPRWNNGRLDPADEFDFDDDQGGIQIGGKLKGLSLAGSKIDGSVDANGGVAYMQWTLLFQNESARQREARTEIQLPPGAVVSRLTLWVNGEEREAAFAGRGLVRQAYQSVVQQRRDPVLVTTAGRDRILVQCFPVPPDNGEMKIRLGLTVPLVLEDEYNVRLLLPHFASRNFRIQNNLTHATWIESKTPMTSVNSTLKAGQFSSGIFALGGGIPDFELAPPRTSIQLTRANLASWSKDPFESGNFIVEQSIVERTPSHLYRIVLVLDTSGGMEEAARNLAIAMTSIPSNFDVKLVVANADGSENLTASGHDEITAWLSKGISFVGGADNVPALLKAWELASERPGNNAIVWLHDPQLIQLQGIEELKQRWERRPFGPTLYSVQATNGSDEIIKRLDGINEVKSVARIDYLEKDLEKLLSRLTGQTKTFEFVRTSKVVAENPLSNESTQTSDHLARLWANDEVARILAARDSALNNAAITLASKYQLVTPVTGAVVLETAQQYDASGLTPVDPGSVPTIPEPEIVVLLIVATIILGCLAWRKLRTVTGGGFTV